MSFISMVEMLKVDEAVISELMTKIAELEKENKELSDKVEDLDGFKDYLVEQLVEKGEKIEELEGEIEYLQGRNEELAKDYKELDEERIDLDYENRELRKENIKLSINSYHGISKACKDLQKENQKLREELEFVRDDNTKFEEDVKQLNSEKRELEAELEDAEQRLIEATTSIAILADEKRGWIRKEDRLINETSDLNRRLVEAGDLIKFLFASNAELRVKNDDTYHDLACELLQIFTDYVDNGPDNLCVICPEEAENRADLLKKLTEIREKYDI